MPGSGANGTCRVYIAEEGGIIRNGMFDLAWGRAGSPLVVGFFLLEQVDPTAAGTASQSEVGVGRGLGG